jgi:hypothetical protein
LNLIGQYLVLIIAVELLRTLSKIAAPMHRRLPVPRDWET